MSLPCGCETVPYTRPPACLRRGPADIVVRRCAAHERERQEGIADLRRDLENVAAAERACPDCPPGAVCPEHARLRRWSM